MNTLKDSKKKFEEEFGDNDFDFEEYADIESVWNFIESTVRQALKETEIEEKDLGKVMEESRAVDTKYTRSVYGFNQAVKEQKQKVKEYLK